MGQIRDQELLDKIALRIKRLREEKGVTQEAFYYETGIHLARIESTKSNISVSTLKAICDQFGISLIEFFERTELN